MRCPSCGTDNEADSRFCGGCGARLAPSRLAPTQKIADSQPAPVQAPAAPRVVPRTPSVSTPPPVQPMAPSVNRPPRAVGSGGNPQPVAPLSSVAERRGASVSLAPPRRRTGLVVGVLVLDLALAAAGGWMLYEGLAAAPKPPATAPAPAPAPTPTVKTGTLEGAIPATPAASALPAPSPRPPPVAVPEPAPTPAPVARKPRAKPGPQRAPLDPYADPPPTKANR